jgi:hypothetical protein
LRIGVQGEPGVGVCHCLACQRRTGSVFANLAGFAPPSEVSGNATEYVHVGDQGGRFRFRFCPVCGTHLFHTEEGNESFVHVAPPLLPLTTKPRAKAGLSMAAGA